MNDIDYIDENEDPRLPGPVYLVLALLLLSIPIIGGWGIITVLQGVLK